VIRELTSQDLDRMKKALSLLREDEQDDSLPVAVEAGGLRALIAAYELVMEQWLQILADYEFLEHHYADLIDAVLGYEAAIEEIKSLLEPEVARSGRGRQLTQARRAQMQASVRLASMMMVEIIKTHDAAVVSRVAGATNSKRKSSQSVPKNGQRRKR
jgi:hypothetical protein